MIRINLLPLAERQSGAPLSRSLFITAPACAVIALSIFGYGIFTIHQLENELHTVHIQYELLRPAQEKMAAAGVKQQQITEKNHVLLNLTAERNSWHAIMTHIGLLTTADVWLTEVSPVQNNALKLKGMAGGYPALAAFITKLEQDDLLTNATLLSVEKVGETAAQTTAAVSFEVLAGIKGMDL